MPEGDFKLLVLIVAYNASAHIEKVLDKIPEAIWSRSIYHSDILILDDASADDTYEVCEAYRKRTGREFVLAKHVKNLGYGGNQKEGYNHAVTHGYDAVVLLHGDGQYDPRLIPSLVEPIAAGSADVVIGSRMIHKRLALQGGMPLYKFIGNIVITYLQNAMLGVRLSEFHSGYRAYRVSSLAQIPFNRNSDYFDFDTDILIQHIQTGKRLHEISVPAFYGDEICYVNGIKYTILVLLSSLIAALQKRGLACSPKFDYGRSDR
jgi:glycosyltransferase involved in cell wall biosynthesis